VELTGLPFLIVSGLLALGTPVAALRLWTRVRGPVPVKVVQRLGLVLACQVTAVLVTAVAVNDNLALYTSWSDLLGADPGLAAITPDPASGGGPSGSIRSSGTSRPAAGAGSATRVPSEPLPGSGRVREETVSGAASGITSRLWILLPKEYGDPVAAQRRYPVVEFFPGYPGTPTTWLHALELQRVMDEEVAAGRVRPFIAVLPTMNVVPGRDTECVDVARGPKVATWLAVDVPRAVESQTRSLPLGVNWGMAGYSTGGFCAVKLLLGYPTTFGSAAVISGYFSPSTGAGLDDLFGGDATLRSANDPMWLLAHRPAPRVNVLTVYSRQDPSTLGPTKAFLAAVRPPLRAEELALTSGGHNTGVWLDVEPQVLQWLSRHLAVA
jgi:enterochelin esterase-like enzyme